MVSGMAASPESVVRDFCSAWSRRDVDELLGFFAPGAVYHNMPLAPAEGEDAIRAILELFVPGSEEIEFEILGLAADGDTVYTERIDRFTVNGKRLELPVAGVFEIRDGAIAAWRDYFDMQAWTTGLS